MSERSTSRGRDLASTGRGGAGNIVRGESASRPRPEDEGAERGRDVYPREEPNHVTHAGRGGQGNVRSPSRDPAKEAAERAFEEEVLRKSREHREQFGVSSGRGGSGNIDRSRSRSREPGHPLHHAGHGFAAGRGGAGNILPSEAHPHTTGELERLEEEERAVAEAHHHHNLLSHGRGGTGNVNHEVDANAPHGTEVTPELGSHIGRGGVGNVLA